MLVQRCLLSVCAQPMAFSMIFVSATSKASSQTESMVVSDSACVLCLQFLNPGGWRLVERTCVISIFFLSSGHSKTPKLGIWGVEDLPCGD